jgi:hypothetical protein
MTNIDLFHQGGLDIQKLTGEQAIASRLSKLIQNSIPTRALDFIRQQSVIWIGIEGQNCFLWAFPLFGSPKFINPSKERLLEINLKNNFPIPDKWHRTFQKGKAIGCLVIDLYVVELESMALFEKQIKTACKLIFNKPIPIAQSILEKEKFKVRLYFLNLLLYPMALN